MGTITYNADVAPHLQRGLMYRRLRMQRSEVLHQRDVAKIFWRVTIPALLVFWVAVAYGIYSI